MTNEDKEKLVKLIASGINTYADIEEILPGAVASAVVDYTDGTSLHLIYPVNKDTHIKSDTIFALTDDGKDILYQLQKEQLAERHFQESLAESKDSTKYAKSAVLWAKIAIAVTLVLFLLEKI